MKARDVTFADARRWASFARPQIWVLVAGAAAVAVHVVILMALRRGFDWSDEAWSYSLIANSRVTEGEAWGFQHLLHGPFEGLGHSVLAFRVVRFVAYGTLAVVGTAVLARISAVLGFRLRRWEWWLVLVVAQIGTFLVWSFPPRYFAYNELSALLAQAGALAIAALVARAGGRSLIGRPSVRVAVWAATGLITVVLTIAKFTSGAAFGVLVLAALVAGDGVFGWGKRCLSVAGGSVAAILWLLVSGFPASTFVSSIRNLLFDGDARAASGHSPQVLFTTYQQALGDGAQQVIVPVALFAVLLGLLFAAGGRVTKDASMLRAGALIFGVLVALSITTLPRTEIFPSVGRFIVMMAFMAIVAFVAGISSMPRESRGLGFGAPRLVGIAALVGAPFVSALGTNMSITGQLLYAATVWCTLFAIALLFIARRLADSGSSLATIPVAILTLFVVVSATQVAGDVRTHPYRSTPYLGQGYSTHAPFLQGILVTKEEAEWADWLVSEGQILDAQNTPTLSLASPGALLIFNNSDYASPWLEDFWPISFDSIGKACRGARPDALLVLQHSTSGEGTANFQLLNAALDNDCSVDFPADFDLVANHDSSNDKYDMSIWKLRN